MGKDTAFEKMVEFIDHCNEVKETVLSIEKGPYYVSMIKHIGTGKFIPKLTRSLHWLRFIRYYLKTDGRLAPGEFTTACECNPDLGAIHCHIGSFEAAWDLCADICDHYKETGRLFEETDQNFFHRHLPDGLIDLVDGALAGDAGLYRRGPSAIFKLALEIKQLGHLEDYVEELTKFGFKGRIRKNEHVDNYRSCLVKYCSITWSLWRFLDHQKRWYDESGKKETPD